MTLIYTVEFKDNKLTYDMDIAPGIGSPDQHTAHVLEKTLVGAIVDGASENIERALSMVNDASDAARTAMIGEAQVFDEVIRKLAGLVEHKDSTPSTPSTPSTHGILNGTTDDGAECHCPMCREIRPTFKMMPLTKGRKLYGVFGICKGCYDSHPDGPDADEYKGVIGTLLFMCPELKTTFGG